MVADSYLPDYRLIVSTDDLNEFLRPISGRGYKVIRNLFVLI
jgi:hypothetical protein